ncbi:hypothetical protein GDO81_025343 [Engystomops pustulosus]|uniref:Pentraxin (PTX) domain-containing protein n=1 Tax=Engystomops pustulosus TaxID=76066 RepID=A0AAV6Z0K4_ENGPU|nr:hypothetical protein GDO81_025343 [Engystomops pustulosus]
MTDVEHEPWWALDLKSNHIITFVAITNRRDCCSQDLEGAEIHVGSSKNWKENPSCGTVSSIGLGETFSFSCGGTQGRYVTVVIPKKNTSLSLCEVQVFGLPQKSSENKTTTLKESENLLHGAPNVAVRGTASHSSTYDPQSGARNAIDGSLRNTYPSCSHTHYDQDPWWTVDLQSRMKVFSVAITNRGECCGKRMDRAEVHIGDARGDAASNPRCAIISSIAQGQTLAVDCRGMEGRFVSIVIEGRKEYLTLCEVQVFALPAEKKEEEVTMPPAPLQPTKDPTDGHPAATINKTTTGSGVSAKKLSPSKVSQSSTRGNGAADKAVDGILTPEKLGCAVTEKEYEPWWKGELRRQYQIHSIAVSSNMSLDGAEIRIGDDADWNSLRRCVAVSLMGPGETVLFHCNWMIGKVVTIVMSGRNESLTVCEVQVFGLELGDKIGGNGEAEIKNISRGVRNVAPRGLILQSSYFDNQRPASVATDGKLETNYGLESCTHTLHDLEPWWRVDMLSRMRVSSVAITNRGDCCAYRLKGAEIRIGNSEEHGGRNNPRCAKIPSIGLGETFIFDCDGMEGRFVTIVIPGRKEYLQLCEVQVFAESLDEMKDEMYHNVALKGVASQSSTFSSSVEAHKANDGSLANNHIMSQCSITQREVSPWWMVDLMSSYQIFAVVITNRVLECCKDRISGAEIRIGNSSEVGGTLNPRCGVITSMGSGESLYFACGGMVGQYVTVTIPGRAEHLILCEVQVFGLPDFSGGDFSDKNHNVLRTPQGAPNLALQGDSFQSSLFNFFGESKNAIDGSLSSNHSQMQCSQTVQELNPWWTVDLRGIFHVLAVSVTNRQDGTWERLRDAEIRIGSSRDWLQNPRCTVMYSLGPGDTGLYSCNGMEGRYVSVVLPDKIEKLSICEVQVFGLPLSTFGNLPSVINGTGLGGAALMFPEEGNQSYAILQPQAPMDLTEFTLCFEVSTGLSGRREVLLFSYCKDENDELNVWRELDGRLSLYLRSSQDGAIFSLPGLSTFGTHICVTWKSSSGITSFWFDGKRSTRQVYRRGHYVSSGGTVILGQDQDTCGGKFDAKQSFVGEISDVHLWDYVLTSSTIKDVYKKKKTPPGNIIDWSSTNYSLYGNVRIESMKT